MPLTSFTKLLLRSLRAMNLIRNARNFYVDYSLHVAFSVVCLVLITAFYVGFKIQISWLVCLGLFTTAVYNFAKYADTFSRWGQWCWVILLFVTGIASVLFFKPQASVWWLVAVAGVLTLWYLFPFFGKNFRSIPVIKVLVVGVIWSLMTVFLPVVRNQVPVDIFVILLGVQRLLLVVVWLLPFEIRDLKTDNSQLKTIPQLVGVFYTKWLGWMLLVFIFCIEIYLATDIQTFVIAASIYLLSGILVAGSSAERSPYYAAFWVEGIPICWTLLLIFKDLLDGKGISVF